MKRRVTARRHREMTADFPLSDLLEGWYFRVTETSAHAYLIEGSDRWGRMVSCRATDPEAGLRQCIAEASTLVGPDL